MYFRNRADAGRKLANKLEAYKKQNISIVALSRGAVIVGAQIAMRLHGNMMLLLTENIVLPGENEAIASVSSAGDFTYNNMFSPGQLEELTGEFHQYIEGKRLEKVHRLNVLMGRDGEVHPEYLRHHVVILVSDGLSSGYSLDIANDFLKTVAIKKLVIAAPIASVAAVDRMHLVGDEICCLSVADNYINTNHYYDDNTIPPVDDLLRMMRRIAVAWKQEEANVSDNSKR
jgi:putative phosphoribosyl transferase